MDTLTAFDGSAITVGAHIELTPSCDLWMRGAKYANVTSIDGAIITAKSEHRGKRLKITADLVQRVIR